MKRNFVLIISRLIIACTFLTTLVSLTFWFDSYQKYGAVAFHYVTRSKDTDYFERELRCRSYRGGLQITSMVFWDKLKGPSLPIGQPSLEIIREPTRDDGDGTSIRVESFSDDEFGRHASGNLFQFPFWIVILVLL